ncbi:MAG: winged helix-turn-helix domain-containing protein [Bradyrhizobium sp.]
MRLTTRDGLIFFDRKLLVLPPKERAALSLLLRFSPDPVSKDRFADEVWGQSEMSDESLARCVSHLRRLLPLDTGITIRPVYGFGYQLSVPILQETTTRTLSKHSRLVDAAIGHPRWVETLLHARNLMDGRDATAINCAREILRNLVAEAPHYMPARVLLIENLALFAVWSSDPNGELISEAEYHVSVVSQRAPKTPGLAAISGHVCDISRRFDEADLHFMRAASENADDPNTHYLRGLHMHWIGKPLEAVQLMRRAVELRPHSVTYKVVLARQEYVAGNFQKAMDTSSSVRSEAENDPTYRSHLRFLETLMGGKPSDAENVHSEVPLSYIFGRSHLSHHFAKLGEREKAIEIIRRFGSSGAERAASFLPALLELGLIDEAMERVEAALNAKVGFLPGLLRKPENARLAIHPRYGKLKLEMFGADHL